jgi:hypothetical protein
MLGVVKLGTGLTLLVKSQQARGNPKPESRKADGNPKSESPSTEGKAEIEFRKANGEFDTARKREFVLLKEHELSSSRSVAYCEAVLIKLTSLCGRDV